MDERSSARGDEIVSGGVRACDVVARFARRDLFKMAAFGGVGLPLAGLVDVDLVRASVSDKKLADVSEFTTSCNFCSCGCGMIAAVKDGKLVTMEGDYDHPVNRGSLCVKGMSMFATH